jgi:hypothetical protein
MTRLTYFSTIELRALHVAIGAAQLENAFNDPERVAAEALRGEIRMELLTRGDDRP